MSSEKELHKEGVPLQQQQQNEIELLRQHLGNLYTRIIEAAQNAQNKFPLQNPENKCSRDNLLCYLALREHDLSDLQLRLAEQGLSSLGRLEGQVMVTLEKVMRNLGISAYNSTTSLCKTNTTDARPYLEKRSQLLLGRPRQGRRTRIMVTLDSSNIHQPELIEQLLRSGMDIARINCAHDTKMEWKMLIEAIRHAEQRLIQRGQEVGRRCRIMMDLAGPKIRTGPMETEVRQLKISVPKDSAGKPIRMVEGYLDSEATQTERISLLGIRPGFVISIPPKQQQPILGTLKLGEKITFKDGRDRLRTLIVLERISPTRVRVGLDRTAYLREGIELHSEVNGSSFTVGPIKPQPIDLQVKAGDILRLYRNSGILGHKPTNDGKPAGISCTLPEVLGQVQTGHRVFIDDGKIGAIVRSTSNAQR
jgi:pyruvate kinase